MPANNTPPTGESRDDTPGGNRLARDLSSIVASLAAVVEEIEACRQRYPGAADKVTLLAVSKKKSAASIRDAFNAGQRLFGENYAEEAIDKMEELRELDIEWHFIGTVQSRKTRAIAEHFAWVQSVDRLKVAERLSEQRPDHLPALNICLQINPDGEASKSGVAPGRELDELAAACHELPGLQLRGLMTIPAPRETFDSQREVFALIRAEFERLQTSFSTIDTLSMGMSSDMPAAIAEGATMVRVGTAIFGPR